MAATSKYFFGRDRFGRNGFIKSLVAVLSLMGILFGCDSQAQQNDFVDEAEMPPNGITETDALGQILSDDKDDWRTAPVYAGKIRVDPVYPNPSFGQFVTLPITILEFNGIEGGVVLRATNSQGTFRLLDEIIDARQPGAYTLRFSPAVIGRTGLVRLFLFDRLGELISYGDLQVR